MTAYRKWLFGGVAVAILIFLVGFLLVVNPARNNAAEIHKQAQEQEQQNAATAAKIQQYEKQAAEVPAKLAEVAAVQQKLPDTLELPALIRAIESEAAQAGVKLISIAPGTPAPYGQENGTNTSGVPIVVVPLAMSASGGYSGIKSFVNGLERMDRAYFMSGVDVSAADAETSDLTLNLTGQVFSVPTGAIGLPSPSPTPTPSGTPAPGSTPTPGASPSPSGSTPGSSVTPLPTQSGQAAAKLDKAVEKAKSKSKK